ncbi:MAG: hypothetical protein Q4A84_01060 [Neisseria sp.]|nr:hypothetical protein [Neisseria sp.]MDO4640282.1 hypothetical protein [Neisseria sp.]
MKKLCLTALLGLCLAACTSNSSNSTTQAYGEIKGGVETSHTSR